MFIKLFLTFLVLNVGFHLLSLLAEREEREEFKARLEAAKRAQLALDEGAVASASVVDVISPAEPVQEPPAQQSDLFGHQAAFAPLAMSSTAMASMVSVDMDDPLVIPLVSRDQEQFESLLSEDAPRIQDPNQMALRLSAEDSIYAVQQDASHFDNVGLYD